MTTLQLAETQNVVNVTAGASQSMEAIDPQIVTAKQYPRDIAGFQSRLRAMVTSNQDVANGCFYALPPRKGSATSIEGPSVRLAEMAVSCWGNLRCKTRVLVIGERTVTAEATAWDMESNILISTEVTRSIWGKHGRYSDDMIRTTCNAAMSVAYRNAVFKVVPGVFINDALSEAKQFLAKSSSIPKRTATMVEKFKTLGVDRERLESLVGKPLESMDADDITQLRGVYNALKDGDLDLESLQPPYEVPPAQGKSLTDRLKEQAGMNEREPGED